MESNASESFELEISHTVIDWIIKELGDPQHLPKDFKLDKEIVRNLEQGTTKFHWADIEKIAECMNLPLASFLTEKAPSFYIPKDRRQPPSGKHTPFSFKTLSVIREVNRLQENGTDLLKNLSRGIEPELNFYSNLSDNPEIAAKKIRDKFGVSVQDQISWRDKKMAFEKWRATIEHENILVFSMPMPLWELRGAAFTFRKPFVILINSNDSPNAMIFTLFHEYGHLLLKEGSSCIPDYNLDEQKNIESWCDEFAAALLMPEDAIKKFIPEGPNKDFKKAIFRIAPNLKVSRAAATIRIKKYMPINTFLGLRKTQVVKNEQRAEKAKKPPQGRKLPEDKKCIKEKGKYYISLVKGNVDQNLITHNKALDILSIKLNKYKAVVGARNE